MRCYSMLSGVRFYINDPFWSPKLEQWSTTTVNDVFDKLSL